MKRRVMHPADPCVCMRTLMSLCVHVHVCVCAYAQGFSLNGGSPSTPLRKQWGHPQEGAVQGHSGAPPQALQKSE